MSFAVTTYILQMKKSPKTIVEPGLCFLLANPVPAVFPQEQSLCKGFSGIQPFFRQQNIPWHHIDLCKNTEYGHYARSDYSDDSGCDDCLQSQFSFSLFEQQEAQDEYISKNALPSRPDGV
ncbi:MAG: hypothetical protein LBU32_17535 [Clostridiales bacterium]|jgi:hypothetical protein|nr:hypothetical protein [Clostridiales bacterium]